MLFFRASTCRRIILKSLCMNDFFHSFILAGMRLFYCLYLLLFTLILAKVRSLCLTWFTRLTLYAKSRTKLKQLDSKAHQVLQLDMSNCNKTTELVIMLQIWDSITSGRAVQDPSLLCQFVLITFAVSYPHRVMVVSFSPFTPDQLCTYK